MKISSVYQIPAGEYNDYLADALKQISEFKEPEWAAFVKTGVSKKRPPQEEDFWYKRAASILRQIYVHKTVGVNRLKTRYGSKKNRGMRPERFKKASGKMIRVILQQAEAAGLLEKSNEPGKRAGRKLTEKGREFLEGIKPIKVQKQEIKEEKQTEEPIEEPITSQKESDEKKPEEDIKKEDNEEIKENKEEEK